MRKTLAALLVAMALTLLSSYDLHAASLSGKVIDVESGDLLTIYNLNRPVKVRLLGVDAPELSQAFGDVAKEHLSVLVLDKFVTVEYWALGEHNSLIGRVLLEGRDIGAQMIRDGAAWYDSTNSRPLSDVDCEVYAKSQEAAESEKRGLWETGGAVAPWEFVKNEAASRETLARAVRASNSLRENRAAPELTNLSLIGSPDFRSATSTVGNRKASYNAPRKPWQRFQPSGENFTVLVPVDGRQSIDPIQSGNSTVDLHSYIVQDGPSVYFVLWAVGASKGERDVAVIKSTAQEMVRGISAAYQRLGQQYVCGPESEQDLSANGFTGREINFSDCTEPTKLRIFTKASDSKRSLYVAMVVYTQPDTNVSKFLESFNVGTSDNLQKRLTQSNRKN